MVNLKKFTENKSYYNKYEKPNQTKKIGELHYYQFSIKIKNSNHFKIFGGNAYYCFLVIPAITHINIHLKQICIITFYFCNS